MSLDDGVFVLVGGQWFKLTGHTYFPDPAVVPNTRTILTLADGGMLEVRLGDIQAVLRRLG